MMMRIAMVSVLTACLGLPGLVSAQDAAIVAKGKAVFAANKCQSCHLLDGVGNKRFPLDAVGAKLSAEDISRWITHPAEMEAKLPETPKIRMKAYKLPDEELKALVAYLHSLK